MLILIPLGGLGTRFSKNNYKIPKPLINVMGKPIIYWLLDNLKISKYDTIIIPYNNELYKYHFENRLTNKYPNYNFIFKRLIRNTDGAAQTILDGLNILELNDQPILCLDGDNFYTQNILSIWKGDNCVFAFEDKSKEEVYSYIKLKDDNIIDIKEKRW